MSRRGRAATRGRAVATLVAIVAGVSLGAPAGASALYDPIGSGSARLEMTSGFTKLLQRAGVRVIGRGAKANRSGATIPVAGGRLDPTVGKGEIELGGDLILATSTRRVALTDITLERKPSPLVAKVGGGQLKVAKASSVGFARHGFGSNLVCVALRLTEKAAARFNKRLHVDAFRAGQGIGRLLASTEPRTLAVLPTGAATIEMRPEFLAKLDALSTSVNSVFPAERQGASISFPLALEGYIGPRAEVGVLRTAGAIEFLRLGAGQIFMRNPSLVIQYAGDALIPAPAIVPEVDIRGIPSAPSPSSFEAFGWALDAPGARILSDPLARTVTVSGSQLTLDASTAQYFNQAFAEGTEAFQAGEALGILSFVAQTQ